MLDPLQKTYADVLNAHRARVEKKPSKTREKIASAIEKAAESALLSLEQPEPLNLKDQKELLGLLMKLVEHMTEVMPAEAKPFNPTETDKALLEKYVKSRARITEGAV